MPRTKIPEGIVAADVIEAAALFLSKSVPHEFHKSEKFDVIVDGKRFPPKAILGLAAMRVLEMPLKPSDFSGGEDSQCFKLLRSL
jgi:5-methylcytosine-specific restriction protein A